MKQALRQRFEENAGALLSCHFVWLAVRFDSRGILSADFNYYFRDNDRVCELNGSRGELRGAPPRTLLKIICFSSTQSWPRLLAWTTVPP